ncbi:hypothetical protein BDV96DRAFT_653110 [Lophiotrema nucula]|uniref:Mid2 domain-containing protein n=1 Tax=Lophiotrema nucula TaxID=690887 RepID=A0A6A5YQ18_9PLEO|nr:hypothetical protein BDV96DRAFT_653110 [Lophiotrema nucula]
MTYTEDDCPDNYAAISTGFQPNIDITLRTLYCCPEVTNWFVGIVDISRTDPTAWNHQFCSYQWQGTGPESSMPVPSARSISIPDGSTTFHNILNVVAVLAVSTIWPGVTTSIAPATTTFSKSTSASTSTSTSASTTPTLIPGSALTHGAKVGIGVGTSIGGILLLSLIPLLVILRRRQKKWKAAALNMGYADKPELHGEAMRKEDVANEVKGAPVYEMPGEGLPAEISANDHPETASTDGGRVTSTDESNEGNGGEIYNRSNAEESPYEWQGTALESTFPASSAMPVAISDATTIYTNHLQVMPIVAIATPGSTTSVALSTTTPSISSGTSTMPTSHAGSSLSTKSKIGISVGAGIGVLLLVFLVSIFVFTRRRNHRQNHTTKVDPIRKHELPKEMQSEESMGREIMGRPIAEMEDLALAVELSDCAQVREMEGAGHSDEEVAARDR